MYVITESQYEAIPDGYKGKSFDGSGDEMCFLCFLTPDGSGGTTLCREFEHFVIIPDSWQERDWKDYAGDDCKDQDVYNLLINLIGLDDDLREDWRRRCMDHFKNDRKMKRLIAIEYATAEKYAHQKA